MRIVYSALLILLSPILLVYTLIQVYKRGGDLRFVAQRMGVYLEGSSNKSETAIWFHAASVGETKAVVPLIMTIIAEMPGRRVVVSTNTCEAAVLIRSTLPESVKHYYFTTDFPFAVQRLVGLIRPAALFVVETEIWPNLYKCCHRQAVPIVIVNARLSDKSGSAIAGVKRLYKDVLADVALVAARNESDAKRYIALGASPERVQVVGNIKFAAALSEIEVPHKIVEDKRYVLFVSTHEGEEVIAGQLKKKLPDIGLIIIVPRHPQRRSSIVKGLESLKLNVAVRSKNEPICSNTDIYLVDTLGEVNGFLSNALAVFVGGSMVPVGGHNVLEPAIYGKPILVGPYLDNIRSEVRLLKDNEALIECVNEEALTRAISDLLDNTDKCSLMGRHARKAIAECESILNSYRDICIGTIRSGADDTVVVKS